MKIKGNQIVWHLIIAGISILMILPILYAVGNSLKEADAVYSNTSLFFLKGLTLENYRRVLEKIPVVQITLNTFIIATITTVFKLITGLMAAYAFAFHDFKGKDLLYFLLIVTIFIPFTVTMIPNYLIISKLGLNDTMLGVALPQLADATGIFLLRQSMRGIPKSIGEVATLDNISGLYRVKDIILPIIRPAVVSTGIIFFVNSWNEYLWPMLILKSKEKFTLPLALQTYISAEAGTDFAIAMAVSVITMALPLVLYIFFQKWIINTFSMSGVKG